MTDETIIEPQPDQPRQGIVSRNGRRPPTETSGSETVMSVIARIAKDKEIPIERMTALLALQERILSRDSENAFVAALARAQSKFPVVQRSGKIVIRNKEDRQKGVPEHEQRIVQETTYAKWEDIWAAVREPLNGEGFTLTFDRGKTPEGLIVITAILRGHGHRETASIELQHDSSGSKNPVQAVGSTISYGKRYTAGMVLNLVSRDLERDDDGESAGAAPTIEPEQVTALNALLAQSKTDVEAFLSFYSERLKLKMPLTSVVELPQSQYQHAQTTLGIKIRQAAKKEAGK